MFIDAQDMHFQALNQAVRSCGGKAEIDHCFGQRFIGSGLSDCSITINGTPGNALGAYLDGAEIVVHGNAQDAVGDTMNDGRIVIHGNVGDALGYAMRGGCIYVKGSSGYRTGIHMKEYKEKKPLIVIGGCCGSFLGEYLAGGLILVLGLGLAEGQHQLGHFTGTGMHGGRIVLRCDHIPADLPEQVSAAFAAPEDLQSIRPYCQEYCRLFGGSASQLMDSPFVVLTPNAKNPYKRLYTQN